MVWLIVVLVIVVVVSLLKRSVSSIDEVWPLESRRPLSAVEQKLYWRLVQALPEHPVLAQVQLSRMMAVKRVPKARAWRNRIDRKSADFVVCNKDFSVAAVIELDDSSHDRADRRKADADKDAALRSAGIRIVRWSVKALPDTAQIQRELLTADSIAGAPPVFVPIRAVEPGDKEWRGSGRG